MSKILPPSRPKRDEHRLRRTLSAFGHDGSLPVVVFIRGHYLDSMGKRGEDDNNIYDDSCFVIADNFKVFESYNANTNPSFVKVGGRSLAELNLGRYRFYRGLHKGRYKALRAFPEGIQLPCTRNGVAATAQYINVHKGSSNPRAKDVVWSEGCLTIPDIQYNDFVQRLWSAMDKSKQKIVEVILLENRQTLSGQRWYDEHGRMVS